MREVKAQALGRNERACLVHMVAENLFERGVEQMRRSVVATKKLTAVMVNRSGNNVALGKRALLDVRNMRVDAVVRLGVGHRRAEVSAAQDTGVAHLSAHLGIEGRAVENDLDVLAGLGALDAITVAHDGENARALEPIGVVAAELGRGQRVGKLGPHVVERAPSVALNVGTGTLALSLHLAVESLDVDCVACALGDLDSEVYREAEGVVQHEGGGSGKRLTLGEFGKRLVEVHATVVERLREALLLRAHDALDERGVLDELRVGVAHELVHAVDEAREERARDAEQATVEHGATKQAAQHVAATLVARQDAVGDHEVDRAGVVGNNAQGAARALVVVAHVARARDLLAELDEALHDVAVEERGLALHDGAHALKTHAGIEVAMRELRHRTVLLTVKLREHEVPVLEETVAVAAGRAIRTSAANVLAHVVVDLGAGTAGSGRTGSPEVVVLAESRDVVLGNAERAPDVVRLVIIGKDREVETILR